MRCLTLFRSLAIAFAVAAQAQTGDLTKLSLEDLMGLDITSVAKREQKVSQAAAAIYVITQEEIRRSGLTSIPELLRLVPGMSVARIDGNIWAITSRGFNGRYADKMLVLQDGRTLYTPLFSGVNWDVQDTVIEDIERIEVIRGPGGTLWGANAVNGVINIITKQAQATQGGLFTATTGSEEAATGVLRYGGQFSPNAFYRVYAKYSNRRGLFEDPGADNPDSRRALRGGFRMDWNLRTADTLTVDADIYDGRNGRAFAQALLVPPYQTEVRDRVSTAGGHVLARWSHAFSPRSDTTVQWYFDRTVRSGSDYEERRNTYDLDFQHHWIAGARHEIVWGLGYRYSRDHIIGSPIISFQPASRGENLANVFFQDQISLKPNRLVLILGTKLEHNDYSGFEIQPEARLLWTPNARNSLWTAVSRAVESLNRSRDVRFNISVIPGPLPSVVSYIGNSADQSQTVLAWEAGYRFQPNRRFHLDLAVFHNNYDNLPSYQNGQPFPDLSAQPPRVVVPIYVINGYSGATFGGEAIGSWVVHPKWKLTTGYSLLESRVPPDSGRGRIVSVNSPEHQARFSSQVQISPSLEWETTQYYGSSFRTSNQRIPSGHRLDTRIGGRLNENLEWSVVGQNLLTRRRLEFADPSDQVHSSPVHRAILGKVTWTF